MMGQHMSRLINGVLERFHSCFEESKDLVGDWTGHTVVNVIEGAKNSAMMLVLKVKPYFVFFRQ